MTVVQHAYLGAVSLLPPHMLHYYKTCYWRVGRVTGTAFYTRFRRKSISCSVELEQLACKTGSQLALVGQCDLLSGLVFSRQAFQLNRLVHTTVNRDTYTHLP